MKPKVEKLRKVAIRELPADSDISKIKNAIAMHRIVPLGDFKTKKLLPPFLCDIFRAVQFVNIYDVISLLGYYVRSVLTGMVVRRFAFVVSGTPIPWIFVPWILSA